NGDPNSSGIYAHDWSVSASGSDHLVVTANHVHDNFGGGINTYAGGGGEILVVGNTVDSNLLTGITVELDTEARDNVVYNNHDGIVQVPKFDIDGVLATADTIDGNRVFGNAGVGIGALGDSIVQGNVVYSNSVGIHGARFIHIDTGGIVDSDIRFG